MNWEEIITDNAGVTERLIIPGGWLYRTIVAAREFTEEDDEKGVAVAMVFVPYRGE